MPASRVTIGMDSAIGIANHALAVAIIDGPYDAGALSGVLANDPENLGFGSCNVIPSQACEHGTFIMGLLGARRDALIPGLCPDCRLLHIPLFVDENSPSASVDELATAIAISVNAGARLINLSLAILDTDSEVNPRLAAALDHAEASGALLLVAAGNQGRRAMGQLLSHPAVIPVAAADASQRLLPESNFGPAISARGVAALGQVTGYVPGGGTTLMSGTSVATAVATGTLAQLWSAHPNVDAVKLRSVLAGLGPRNGSTPPILNRDFIMAALDQQIAAPVAVTGVVDTASYAILQGATIMANGNGQPTPTQGAGLTARPPQTVMPAGCGCGAPGGTCTCNEADDLSGFVYAIGTIEAEYPNIGIEREMQAMARHLGIEIEPDRDLSAKATEDRHWQHAVLSRDPKLTRYIARQLRWRLTIEDFPVFVLSPGDPNYLEDLIDALNRPKYTKPARSGGKRAAKEAPPIEAYSGHAEDLDVVVGVIGPQTANGTSILVDQLFQITHSQCTPSGLPYFSQISDNHGITDADRAYNFLAARYTPPLPSQLGGFELCGLRVTPSRLGTGFGRILRGIYTFRNNAGAEKEYFVRVDVTNEFPLMISPMQPYLERGERS